MQTLKTDALGKFENFWSEFPILRKISQRHEGSKELISGSGC